MNEYLEKLRSVGHIRGGRTWRTKDQVVEKHTETGERIKSVTDQLGNTVTERSSTTSPSGVTEHQDVTVRPETVRQNIALNGD